MGNCQKKYKQNNIHDPYFVYSDYTYKVIFIGNSGVGKSSVISRITKNEFILGKTLTIGVEFVPKIYKIKKSNNKLDIIRIEYWDTSGQDRYRSYVSAYYRNAYVIILMFSLDDQESLNNIKNWIDETLKYEKVNAGFFSQNPIYILVGNKSDNLSESIVDKNRENIDNITKLLNCNFYQVSALTGENCDKIVKHILRAIKNDMYLIKNLDRFDSSMINFVESNETISVLHLLK